MKKDIAFAEYLIDKVHMCSSRIGGNKRYILHERS